MVTDSFTEGKKTVWYHRFHDDILEKGLTDEQVSHIDKSVNDAIKTCGSNFKTTISHNHRQINIICEPESDLVD